VAADVTRNLSAAGRVPNVDGIVQVEVLDKLGQIVGVTVDGSVGASECWLGLADRGLGHGVCELVAADEHEDRGEREQRYRAEHPERGLEAAGERRGCGVAGMDQRLGVARCDA
jgi:hypothetical protein